MDKLCKLLVKHSIQSLVVRRNPVPAISHFACYSSTEKPVPPPSKNPKHKTSPLITLLQGSKIEVVTLDQAKKLAERRQLKLISIQDFDAKTQRPVYKLMTGAEFHEEEIKRREEKKAARQQQHIKSEKLLTLGSKITEHDLNSKIAKCVKWIEKLHEVRVVISADESEIKKVDKIVETIEKETTKVNARILQKRVKDGTVKFSIMPTIKKEAPSQPVKPVEPKKILEPEKIVNEAQQIRSFHTFSSCNQIPPSSG